ncbi:cuticle protein 18.6 [Anabrus simplex]|uniref:cuticle protein 18.6 n=1 Tax=Anabrus simplex TaxID=316456 RepID=UPI0035A3556C
MTAAVAVTLADLPRPGVKYLSPTADYMGDLYLPPAPRQSPGYRTASPAVGGFGVSSGAHVSSIGGFASPASSYISPRRNTYAAPVPPRTASYTAPPTSTSTGYANPAYRTSSAGFLNAGGYGGGGSAQQEKGMPFDFAYAVKDVDYGTDFSHNAASDGDVVKGEYRVQLPDGRLQVVRYSADRETGYHADISYEGEARFSPNTQTSYGGNKYYSPANIYRADAPRRGFSSPPSNAYLPSSVNYPPV